jgi:hypothetical protein
MTGSTGIGKLACMKAYETLTRFPGLRLGQDRFCVSTALQPFGLLCHQGSSNLQRWSFSLVGHEKLAMGRIG